MIESVCVCGAGTMGSGIAMVFARGGLRTILYDAADAALDRACSKVNSHFHDQVAKGRMDEAAAKAAIDSIQFVSSLNECRAALVIEAIVEDLQVKQKLFRDLIAAPARDSLLATNTSSLSVTALAEALPDPTRLVGMHFFNPPASMKLVELVATRFSSPQLLDDARSLLQKIGKTVVDCRDFPGFIVNHVARPYYLEALRLLESGVADVETIDRLMESAGFKMGPFRLMDLIGNDVNYAVSVSVYEALGRPERLKPSPIQEEKVKSGALGRKTGYGYYHYDPDKPR